MTLHIPVPSSTLATNLLGALGLIGICLAVGMLASWPWALLAAGVFAVALAALAQIGGQQQAAVVTDINARRKAA